MSIHFSKPAADAIILLAILVLPLSYLSNGGGGAELCATPPDGNPNLCHIYTWSPFPVDVGVTPKQGLFNNDTSYYFTFNVTNVAAFQICGNFMAPLPASGGNATLVLQWYNGTVGNGWANADPTQGGALALFNNLFNIQTSLCSLTIGHLNIAQLKSSCGPFAGDGVALSGGGSCSFRIAGNEGDIPLGVTADSMTIAQLYVQFFSASQVNNLIICSMTTISVTGFTNTCNRLVALPTSQAITVRWQADNLTSAGMNACLTRNCFRGPSQMTCSIPTSGSVCTNTVTFSPGFTGTVRASENWTPLNSGTLSLSSPMIVPILT